MLVNERMTRHPITVHPDTTVEEALKIVRESKVRRLPVLDKHGRLVGIVTEKDLLYASPSPATTLSIYEIHSLFARLKVEEVMSRDVITISEYTPIEDAARIMADNGVGGLPVMRDGKLVGIITETDIFKILLEMMGAREKGVRITLLVPEERGMLATITQEIRDLGGNIIALGTFLGDDPTNRLVTIKVADVEEEALTKAMEALGLEIIDVRTSGLI